LLIIDDFKGRKYAEQLGVMITGSLGVLIEAKLSGHIASVKPLLEKIKQTNFRLTDALEQSVLEKSGAS
jgi:predicted nucleic acid-binding protein